MEACAPAWSTTGRRYPPGMGGGVVVDVPDSAGGGVAGSGVEPPGIVVGFGDGGAGGVYGVLPGLAGLLVFMPGPFVAFGPPP